MQQYIIPYIYLFSIPFHYKDLQSLLKKPFPIDIKDIRDSVVSSAKVHSKGFAQDVGNTLSDALKKASDSIGNL